MESEWRLDINNETTKVATNEGTIENYGTINVSDDNSVGMYAAGSGSKAINRGTINLSGNNTTGMYIDRFAELFRQRLLQMEQE